jgi:3'(2'), 5'-bisphosphate nucleotidase
MNLKPEEIFPLLALTSVKAGLEILAIRKSGFSVETKSDFSPVTLADQKAGSLIEKELKVTGIPVLSEEGKKIPYEVRSRWEKFWLVDPLDGTKEFIRGGNDFTVNISLIENGNPVMGIVFVPETGLMYYADPISGALKFRIGKEQYQQDVFPFSLAQGKRLPNRQASRPFTVVASRSHMNEPTRDYIDDLKKQHPDLDLISAGSSLKFCLVAEGKADQYPRFGPTMEWDTGAGHAIVLGAGKKVIVPETGSPLKYNKENLLNPDFLVC